MATEIDIPAMEQRHIARLEPWVKRGVALVSGKIADARAHAEKAVTDTLRQTPDGRASVARIRQNPSFQAALNRLDELHTALAGPDELHTALAGPSVTSISGLVHDAAEAAYTDSRDLWWDQIDPDYRAPSKEPTREQKTNVRGLLWYGLPVRQGFKTQFQTAHNNLLIAVSAAGSTQATNRDGFIALRTWEEKTKASLMSRLGAAMVDANVRADREAMKHTIHSKWHAVTD
jgi:hypothetical protein